MTFRSMMVHLDNGEACEQRIGMAARTARRFGGRLVGIYAVPTAESPFVEPGALPPIDAAKRIKEKEERQRAEESLRRIAESCRAADVEFRIAEGDPIDAVIGQMRCVDLAILGQPDSEDDPAGFRKRLAESVMLGCGAPVLLIPYATSSAELGGNVLVAWDGGREAARAVRDALPLLGDAKHVTVISAAEKRVALDAMQRSHERLANYLAVYGIEPQFKQLDPARDEIGQAVLSKAADIGADLIVMGAYGHARVRELVLGGVTRTILETMTVPVLMSH